MRCACSSLQDICMFLPHTLQHFLLNKTCGKEIKKEAFTVTFVPQMPIFSVDFLFGNIQECGYRGERHMVGTVKHDNTD